MKLSSLPLLLLLVTSCVRHSVEIDDRPRIRQFPAMTRFNQFLIADGAVLFESWNGTHKGNDCDFRIRLKPDHQIILELDGIGPVTYRGTYELDHQGRLKVIVPSYRNGWPVMVMKMEKNVLKLYREDGVTNFDTESRSAPGFWPFVCKNRADRGC